MTRILLVEDHADLAAGLAEHFAARGHEVATAPTAAGALTSLRREPPDLVILDLMLPDLPGDRVLRTARREGYDGPVLILSARGDETSKLRGFRAGADDYVTKPFSLLELIARAENLVRRIPRRDIPDRVRLDERVTFDLRGRRLWVDGEEVQIRPRAMDLLVALVHRSGEAVARSDLLTSVWGYGPEARTRTIDWHVAALRRAIEADPGHPRLVETVRRVGYRLRVEPPAE